MDRRKFLKGCIFGSLAGLLYMKAKDKDFFLTKKTSTQLFCVEVHLADHCNLNCKYCCHFSSIADKFFYDLNQFEKDISKLSQITEKNIYMVSLMGGEPLLNPDVNKYMKIARKYFPNSVIRLYTNGLLLDKMSNDFWKTIRDYDITLLPSFYKIDVNWKDILHKAGNFDVTIPFDYAGYIETFDNMNLDLKGSQKNLKKCQSCLISYTYSLYLGRIYVCPVMAYIKYFNKKFNQNVEVKPSDYLDLYKIQNVSEILDYGAREKQFCRYCRDFFRMPWENSTTHTMDEWGSYK